MALPVHTSGVLGAGWTTASLLLAGQSPRADAQVTWALIILRCTPRAGLASLCASHTRTVSAACTHVPASFLTFRLQLRLPLAPGAMRSLQPPPPLPPDRVPGIRTPRSRPRPTPGWWFRDLQPGVFSALAGGRRPLCPPFEFPLLSPAVLARRQPSRPTDGHQAAGRELWLSECAALGWGAEPQAGPEGGRAVSTSPVRASWGQMCTPL